MAALAAAAAPAPGADLLPAMPAPAPAALPPGSPQGVPGSPPSSRDSFVLRRLQERLQELEAENDELRASCAALEAQCETDGELLETLQSSLDETSAEAEEADARAKALEQQLQAQRAAAARPPDLFAKLPGSPLSRASSLESVPDMARAEASPGGPHHHAGGPHHHAVFFWPAVLYQLAVAVRRLSALAAFYRNSAGEGAWAAASSAARPAPSAVAEAVWSGAAAVGLLYAGASGAPGARRAACATCLAYHAAGAAGAYALQLDLEAFGSEMTPIASAGTAHLALALLLLAAFGTAAARPRKPKAV